jgi:hypothetical protein
MEVDMPSKHDINRQRKLLIMYRGLLAEYLRQQQEWSRAEIPSFLSTGITVLRGHILEVKGTLRGWRLAVDDHSDDEGINDNLGRKVEHQRNLLKIHRTTLAGYLSQRQQLEPGHITPLVINSIQHSRNEIQRIKAILRGWGVAVDDLPEEEPES